jgi:hypothetical protein
LNYTDKQISNLENSPTTAHALTEGNISSKNVSIRRDGRAIIFNEADKAKFESVPIERIDVGKTSYDMVNKLNASLRGSKDFDKVNLVSDLRQAIRDDLQGIQEKTGKPVFDLYEKAMGSAGEAYRIRESNFIQSMIEDSMEWKKDQSKKVFSPIKFREAVTNNMPVLESMFKNSPEIPRIIDAYADKMLGAASDLAKFKMEKPSSFLEKMAAGGAGFYGGVKLVAANPLLSVGLIVPYGFETAMAHSLAHPGGWLKKLVYAEPMKEVRGMMRPPVLTIPSGIANQEQRKRPYMNIRPGEQTGPETEYLPVE